MGVNPRILIQTLNHEYLCVWSHELGVTILQDLSRQRETIVHARDTLHGADDNIGRARKILSTMSRRITTNKIIMFGICIFLLAGILLIIYVKVK